ncbi:hypothetical protein LWI29_031086 [Acer saccharum]|uniref:MADS-box domain-containing protein n=1 Tax=Acer saccharum TaxID=4024 RepID=A0AA39TJU1_ACESA|nr:hypothetical protein LWI29_031086 [Acer saccharum]
MTREKVKLCYIANDSARKTTFKKRKKGLLKKVSEINTLCGTDTCAIIYSPYDNQPDVWPSNHEVERIVSKFKRTPEMNQSKKTENQNSFLERRIMKSNEHLQKLRNDNREKEMTEVMFQTLAGKSLHPLGLMEVNDLGSMIEQQLKEIDKIQSDTNSRMVIVTGSSSSSSATAAAAAALVTPTPSPPPPPTDHGVMMNDGDTYQAAAALMELMNHKLL